MTIITEKDPIVEKKIGNKLLQMKESHKLPLYFAEFPFYDRALPRICKELKKIDGYLSVIDIGANIGDTVSLITDEVQGSFLCVDGDKEYIPFLKNNTGKIKESKIVIEESYCGESNAQDGKLEIRRENGTARLEWKNEKQDDIKLKSLDKIVEKQELFKKANLLKIDTDGFEISVLKSGELFIKDAQPVIYFEFDPEFYLINNPDPLVVFDLLYEWGYYEALFYDNFGVPIKILNISDKKEIKNLMDLIDKKNIYYFDVLICHHSKRKLYNEIFNNESNNNFLISTKKYLDLTRTRLDSVRAQLEATKTQAGLISEELDKMRASREWKLVLILQKLFQILIPKNSLRRKVTVIFWRFIKLFLKTVKKIKSEILLRINYLIKLKPRNKKEINKESKKIAYIGHSYHSKTKSTEFLIKYLKEFYNVEEILDESWLGKQFPDLSFIDESYLAVIFFQNLPELDILKKIENNNIIFFPMYDGVRHDYGFWSNYCNLKVINFSTTLHKKLIKWGLDSLGVQYFPQPHEFIPGNMKEVFFWNRISQININVLARIFGKSNKKIHIHKAIDPGHQFVSPSEDDEKKFGITYSDWFETREEMQEVIRQKGIYIAPREFEGIGMSFLEAMSMGKAVVAANNPTMNEYIEHGKTGYLFDLKNPKEIDFSDIENVQKNAHAFMQKGYEKWEKEKHRIIDFIEQE